MAAALPGETPFDRTMARLERQFLAMDRMVDDSSAVDKLMARLEHPLLDMSPLARMLERPLVDTSVVARGLQPLIDTTSVLDRLLERPSAMGKAMERMMDGLERPLIDTTALDKAMARLEGPLIDTTVLDRLLERPSAMDKLMARMAERVERPLIDTSALDRAVEHFERSSVFDPSAVGDAVKSLSQWLDEASALDRALDGMPLPHVDPSVVAAVTAAARTVASRASDIDLDQASWGLSAAWATFVVYVATFTDGEISADVSAYVALFFVLLNGLAARRRS